MSDDRVRSRRAFVASLGSVRRDVVTQQVEKPAFENPLPMAGGERASVALLVEAGLPRKVAATYAEAFEGSIDRIASLSSKGSSLPPHESRRYERVLEALYNVLGRVAAKAAHVIAPTLSAVDALWGDVRRADDRVSATFAAAGIIDAVVRLAQRGVLRLDAQELEKACASIPGLLADLVSSMEGRANQSTALGVLPSLFEQVAAKAGGASAADIAGIFSKAARYLVESSPSEGFDQGVAGELAGRLAKAIRNEATTDAAIESAKAAFLLSRKSAYDETRSKIEGAPEPLRVALLAILDGSPAGPEALFSALSSGADHAGLLGPCSELIASVAGRSAARSLIEALIGGLDPAKLLPLEGHPELVLAAQLACADKNVPRMDELLREVLAFAGRVALADPVRDLSAFAARFAAAIGQLDAVRADPSNAAVAAAIASPVECGDAQFAGRVVTQLEMVERLFPDLGDRPGIASKLAALLDPKRRYFTPVEELLESLLTEAQPFVQGDRKKQLEIFEVAVKMVRPLAEIADNGPLFNRVRQDFRVAIEHPERLEGGAAKGIALRAQAVAPSLALFLRTHPSLSLEAAVPIGIHLSGRRFDWVEEQLKGTRRQDHARAIRDTVVACIDAGRLDFIDVLMSLSHGKGKARERVMQEVGRAFRAGKLEEVPFDAWALALKEGRDPIFELEQKKIEATLAELNLAELAKGNLDPKGVASILACKAQIAKMLEQFVPGFRPPLDSELDYGCLRPVVLETLSAVANGTWPSPKYENASGKKILGRLTPKQQAIWRENGATFATPPKPADPQAIGRCLVLLNGIMKALPKTLPLPEGFGFDGASLERARSEHGSAVARFRETEKGTDARKEIGKQLGALSESLAFLELHQALTTLGADPTADALDRLQIALSEARSFARRHETGSGLVDVIGKALEIIGTLAPPPKQGRYAFDEDDIVAIWTGNKSGCLSIEGGGSRIWGLPGAAADANIKRLRVMDGDRQLFRAWLKFFPVKFDGYEGMAVFVDNPVADGGGSEEDRRLLHRHAMEKALAMGIPVMSGALYADYYNGWALLAEDGEAKGLPVKKDVAVKFFFEEGNTPYQHSDCVLNDGNGGTNFHGRIRHHRGANEFWERDLTVKTIVMPR